MNFILFGLAIVIFGISLAEALPTHKYKNGTVRPTDRDYVIWLNQCAIILLLTAIFIGINFK